MLRAPLYASVGFNVFKRLTWRGRDVWGAMCVLLAVAAYPYIVSETHTLFEAGGLIRPDMHHVWGLLLYCAVALGLFDLLWHVNACVSRAYLGGFAGLILAGAILQGALSYFMAEAFGYAVGVFLNLLLVILYLNLPKSRPCA